MGFSQPVLPDLPLLRRQKGISLDFISNSTRIGKRYLEAIERGAFAVLPGGIYNISYIRQYARAADFDAELLLEVYFAATGSAASGDGPAPSVSSVSRWTLFNVSIHKLRKT